MFGRTTPDLLSEKSNTWYYQAFVFLSLLAMSLLVWGLYKGLTSESYYVNFFGFQVKECSPCHPVVKIQHDTIVKYMNDSRSQPKIVDMNGSSDFENISIKNNGIYYVPDFPDSVKQRLKKFERKSNRK